MTSTRGRLKPPDPTDYEVKFQDGEWKRLSAVFASLLPGSVFASEQDLQSRSEVGRSVVRLAVRLLEQRGVASMRRGVGGGLIPDRQ
jgi:hypothetical protein